MVEKNDLEDYIGIRSNLSELHTGWGKKPKAKEFKQVKTSIKELKEMKIKVS